MDSSSEKDPEGSLGGADVSKSFKEVFKDAFHLHLYSCVCLSQSPPGHVCKRLLGGAAGRHDARRHMMCNPLHDDGVRL